jgi:hypothetical protein
MAWLPRLRRVASPGRMADFLLVASPGIWDRPVARFGSYPCACALPPSLPLANFAGQSD